MKINKFVKRELDRINEVNTDLVKYFKKTGWTLKNNKASYHFDNKGEHLFLKFNLEEGMIILHSGVLNSFKPIECKYIDLNRPIANIESDIENFITGSLRRHLLKEKEEV